MNKKIGWSGVKLNHVLISSGISGLACGNYYRRSSSAVEWLLFSTSPNSYPPFSRQFSVCTSLVQTDSLFWWVALGGFFLVRFKLYMNPSNCFARLQMYLFYGLLQNPFLNSWPVNIACFLRLEVSCGYSDNTPTTIRFIRDVLFARFVFLFKRVYSSFFVFTVHQIRSPTIVFPPTFVRNRQTYYHVVVRFYFPLLLLRCC